LPVSRVCIHWRPNGLRKHRFGYVPPARRLYRPNSQRREARRAAGPAGDQSGARHQHEDRQGARPHRPAADDWPRRRGDRMMRRDFITLLSGTAAAWPFAARAQQQAMPVIGFLNQEASELTENNVTGFRKGLSESGFVENQNVTIEYRWAEARYERLPQLAADLVERKVAVIASAFFPATLAAKAATSTIPIVFMSGVDPVAAGLVASLSQPGGNLTGLSNYNTRLIA